MKKVHLGIDFDNTIVLYDQIFYDLAFKKGYIEKNTSKNKKAVRDMMIKKGIEEKFTEMQGEIYGKLISNSKMQLGLSNALQFLAKRGVKISIVSHKTKFPIKGKKYDLHNAALMWLKKNKFFDEEYIGLKQKNVYFEPSVEAKVKRIEAIGCTHFIDDLEKILEKIDESIVKILFSKKIDKKKVNSDYLSVDNWKDICDIILKNKIYL